ncbi:MAG: aspartate aminotransferase family protein [Acidimicrobiia bacterium]|nr:aspartate aminotransferase family protein [Acidimicrobiia bacterium]
MGIQGPKTAELFDRAFDALVNGVSSGWRYWGRDETIVITRGRGGHVWDADGKRYIDFHMGFGPIILGHGDEHVANAVAAAVANGTTFAFTQEQEITAAETVKKAVPWVEKLRFTNTGTEATMHAVRLARGFTGRDVVVKFEGTYHGAHDYVMYSTPGFGVEALGSPYRPVPVAMSSGMPNVIGGLVRTLGFNDLDAVARLFEHEGNRIAALIVEPMLGNAMGIEPEAGFLEGLRSLCDQHGAVLIFDEVKTGFRIAVGGAAETYGVVPDVSTFAKAMGNGLPVAAIAGRGEVLNGWARGGIVQAGTYSGNAVSTAAAQATIERLLTGEPMAQLEKVGSALMEGTSKILAAKGVPSSVQGRPAMFGFFFGEEAPRDYRTSANHDGELYEKLVMAMISRGVMPSPEAHEPWFLAAAHTDEDVATTLQVFEESLDEALN